MRGPLILNPAWEDFPLSLDVTLYAEDGRQIFVEGLKPSYDRQTFTAEMSPDSVQPGGYGLPLIPSTFYEKLATHSSPLIVPP